MRSERDIVAAHITDATDTSASDQSAPINAIILALEEAGILAKS